MAYSPIYKAGQKTMKAKPLGFGKYVPKYPHRAKFLTMKKRKGSKEFMRYIIV